MERVKIPLIGFLTFLCKFVWPKLLKLWIKGTFRFNWIHKRNLRYRDIFRIERSEDLKFVSWIIFMLKLSFKNFGGNDSICSNVRSSQNNFFWSRYPKNSFDINIRNLLFGLHMTWSQHTKFWCISISPFRDPII